MSHNAIFLAFESQNVCHLKRWLSHRVVSDVMRVLRRCRCERSKPLENAATLCVTTARRAVVSNWGKEVMLGLSTPSSSEGSVGLPESSWIIMSCHEKWEDVYYFIISSQILLFPNRTTGSIRGISNCSVTIGRWSYKLWKKVEIVLSLLIARIQYSFISFFTLISLQIFQLLNLFLTS